MQNQISLSELKYFAYRDEDFLILNREELEIGDEFFLNRRCVVKTKSVPYQELPANARFIFNNHWCMLIPGANHLEPRYLSENKPFAAAEQCARPLIEVGPHFMVEALSIAIYEHGKPKHSVLYTHN